MLSHAAQLERTHMFDEEKLTAWHLPAEPGAQTVATTADAVRACRRLADGINASGFSFLFTAAQGDTRRLAPVFDSEFPGVSALSRALSGRQAEEFARRAAAAAAPLWWRSAESAPRLCATARCWTMEIESPFPDVAGIAFPVGQERGRSGLIAFAGDDIILDEAGLCETHARCFSLFGDVARQRKQDCARTPAMSRREIECLRLTANGHTSDDIAAALGLSVHTANQYLTNSTHKLNAVNRIHAVAKALRTGLID